jgi:hypothetical protein
MSDTLEFGVMLSATRNSRASSSGSPGRRRTAASTSSWTATTSSTLRRFPPTTSSRRRANRLRHDDRLFDVFEVLSYLAAVIETVDLGLAVEQTSDPIAAATDFGPELLQLPQLAVQWTNALVARGESRAMTFLGTFHG